MGRFSENGNGVYRRSATPFWLVNPLDEMDWRNISNALLFQDADDDAKDRPCCRWPTLRSMRTGFLCELAHCATCCGGEIVVMQSMIGTEIDPGRDYAVLGVVLCDATRWRANEPATDALQPVWRRGSVARRTVGMARCCFSTGKAGWNCATAGWQLPGLTALFREGGFQPSCGVSHPSSAASIALFRVASRRHASADSELLAIKETKGAAARLPASPFAGSGLSVPFHCG